MKLGPNPSPHFMRKVGLEVRGAVRVRAASLRKVGPRRGDSWLKRMPLDACKPYASRRTASRRRTASAGRRAYSRAAAPHAPGQRAPTSTPVPPHAHIHTGVAIVLPHAHLVEASALLEAGVEDGVQQAQRADGVNVGRVLRRLKRDLDVRLRGEVVDLVRPHLRDDLHEARRVGQVAVVQEEPRRGAAYPLRVERRRPTANAVDLVALVEQQLGEVGAILARDARDERHPAPRRRAMRPRALGL
eukprot:7382391-Prymnesium_polylepis.2